MFDLHRHITSADLSDSSFYATSTKEEWEEVTQALYGGIGLLPSEPLVGVEEIYSLLVEYPRLQIAEVGLDRRYANSEEQEVFLVELLKIAVELERSVTLHCVRREGRLLEILKKVDRRPRLLWHSFSGSYEVAKEAAALDIILSFGPRLKDSKLSKEGKHLTNLPFGLESDYDRLDEEEYEGMWKTHQVWFGELVGWNHERLLRNNDEKRTILTY